MAVLQWSETLQLDEPVMDATHREFVVLLNQLDEAGDEELSARLDAFIALAEWFPHHASTMDAMLASFMQNAGFNPGADS